MREEPDTKPTLIRSEEGDGLRCFFCMAQSVTVLENYCYGCGVLICTRCSDPDTDPWGKHESGDHLAAGEGE